MVLWTLLTSITAIGLPKLSSYPSAQATIFLDFDGQYVVSTSWNGGQPINCAASGMTDAQITEAFNRVAEDYRPFNVNITTDSTVFLAAPLIRRVRIIITPTSSWYPSGVGGISWTGSFTWGDDTPAFVFSDRLTTTPKYIGECCTHESGHTLGLSHQAQYSTSCTLLATYNAGTGTGEIGWAPVMGNSYYKNMTLWNNGPTPSGCKADQDNLTIITTQNGFTYRTDDYSDDPSVNPSSVAISNTAFSTSGIVSTTTDKDAFKFVLPQSGKFHLDARPYSVNTATLDGADLDIKLMLLNSAYQTIGTYDPATLLNATIDTSLTAGTYYVVVQGTGNLNTSDYGSLGYYDLFGTFFAYVVLPIKDASLTGKADKGQHNLKWNIISDDPVKTLGIESSTDGLNFTTLAAVASSARSFTYTPFVNADIFYRIKIIASNDQVAYSNIITLKSGGNAEQVFKVSTFVHNEIKVNASANYQYQLADISGRIIRTGNSNAGINTINVSNAPNGIYVMQIISNNQRQTDRIIKQ